MYMMITAKYITKDPGERQKASKPGQHPKKEEN